MKLTREDFKMYDASMEDNWSDVWIQKRIFKRKYVLFGQSIQTDEFKLIIDGDSPLSFPNIDEAEKFIKLEIDNYNE